jgi:hypothetical protein
MGQRRHALGCGPSARKASNGWPATTTREGFRCSGGAPPKALENTIFLAHPLLLCGRWVNKDKRRTGLWLLEGEICAQSPVPE